MSAARLWPAAALALMLLAACGGSGDPAPAPPGPPTTQSVDAAGGKIVLTSSGIKTTLDIPAGALTAATSITVTPVAPVVGESARMSVTPAGLRFARPVTVTFELPAGRTPNKAAALVLRLNGRPLMLASTVDATARTVSAQFDVLGQFTRSSAASARVLARAHALAASAPDTPPDGTLSLQDQADVVARVAEAQAELVDLQVDGEFDKAIVLKLTIAQLLQSSGLDGYAAQAEPWLAGAKLSACAAFAQASQRASAQVISNLGDYDLFARGVLYWEGISNALGGDPCPGPGADAVLQPKLAQVAAFMTGQVATPQTPAAFAPLANEVSGDVELGRQATTLDVQGVEQHTDTTFVQPVVQPLRDAAFTTAGQSGDQQAYLPLLAALPDVSELQHDAQYADTTLMLVSKDASGTVLGTVTLGRGASPGAEVTTATVQADVAGSIELSGNVAVLHCPNAASERLETQFEAIQIDDVASNGDALLAAGQTLAHGVSGLLAAAGIAPANATQASFTIRRVGSTCAQTFGGGDVTLATVTLDFSNLCTPPTGYNFCVQAVLRSDGTPVGPADSVFPMAITDQDEVLFARCCTHVTDAALLLWKAGQVSDLAAGMGTSPSTSSINSQATVLSAYFTAAWDQHSIDYAVVTRNGSPVVLPLPPVAAGPYTIDRSIRSAVLGDDGTVIGAALLMGGAGGTYSYVLKWTPPYTSYTVLQGPLPQPSGRPEDVASISPSGKAVGTHWDDVNGSIAYQWNPSAAVNGLAYSSGAVFIDDHDAIYYYAANAATGTMAITVTPLPPHLGSAETPMLNALSHSGFALLCDDSAINPPRLRQVYDGREWDMSAGVLVSPASGFGFTAQQQNCFTPGLPDQRINRRGHLLGTATRNGVTTPVILTPRGVALP